jgi:hypothetical protein
LTCGLSGPNPRRNRPRGWLARSYVGLTRGFMDTCLHEKRKAKAVEAVSPDLPAGRHMVSYCLSQVSLAPPRPYKYPSPEEIRTHTPLHGNSTCKALILSLVARHSLVERVVRLWGPEGLLAYWEPSS